MKHNTLFGWRSFLLFILLLVLLSSFLYFPSILLTSPVDTSVLATPLLFTWQSPSKVSRLLVDDVIDFTSPLLDKQVSEDHYTFSEPLNQSVYYWKVIGISHGKTIESQIAQFYFQSEVAINTSQDRNTYTLTNAGNVPLQITQDKQRSPLTGAVVLDIGKSLKQKIENTTLFRAEQQ